MAVRPETLADNLAIAGNLRELGDIIEVQGAEHFRVQAYRAAADTIVSLDQPLARIFEEGGIKALVEMPAIGASIAGAIAEMITTGRWAQLERLRGVVDPEALFRTVPGIGRGLADRIHEQLHIDNLEALENAAYDGQLATVHGMGPRRIDVVRAALGERLGRRRIRRTASAPPPPISNILSVDREYREKAAAGALKTIAPKRFNPSGEAWLPVLHTHRSDWSYTALFSNTRRAHDLNRTSDWVIIYYESDHAAEGQCTVVTEFRGPLRGARVVRGREAECGAYYERHVRDPLIEAV